MIGAPLSVKFQHYYLHFILIILAIIHWHLISKHENGIHCRNEPRWKELKQHIFTRCQARSMRPVTVLWRKLRWTNGGSMACSEGGLGVFQPTSTHGWTKLIGQVMVFQSLGCCFPVKSCRYTLPTYSTTHPGASSAKQSMF
jgi:hypothetical protein